MSSTTLRKFLFAIVFLVTTAASATAQIRIPDYYLTHLGFAGSIGGVHQPLGISSSGLVVGYDDLKTYAFTYVGGTVTQTCSVFRGFSQAAAISNNGTYVGTGNSYGGILVKWDSAINDCDWFQFETINGSASQWLTLGVNDSGDMVTNGPITLDNGQIQTRAVFYPGTSLAFTLLGTFGGPTVATAINNSDEIAGYSVNNAGYTRAYFMSGNASLRDFDPNNTRYDSAAYALNNHGVIVGTSNMGGRCPGLVFSYACRGPFTYPVILSTSPITNMSSLGGVNGAALAVNNNGVIVGWSATTAQAHHGFIYTNGKMTDLNSFSISGGAGWTITEASAINDNGTIVGHATGSSGQDEIVILTPPLKVLR